MREAFHGAILLGCWAIGLFFFRYWRQTRQRLFRYFGAAFWLLAGERVLLLSVSPIHEFHPYIYSVRLIAFLLIIFAIVDENRTRPSGNLD
jgi:hypothetical protein